MAARAGLIQARVHHELMRDAARLAEERGITVSELVRLLLVREVSAERKRSVKRKRR